MDEENKNQKPQEQKSQQPSPNQTAKPSQKEKAAKPGQPLPKKERPKECTICNKSIKERWYYREGNYYCSKSCWKKSKKQKEKSEEKPQDK